MQLKRRFKRHACKYQCVPINDEILFLIMFHSYTNKKRFEIHGLLKKGLNCFSLCIKASPQFFTPSKLLLADALLLFLIDFQFSCAWVLFSVGNTKL